MSIILALLMLMFAALAPVLHTYQMLFFSIPFFFLFSAAPFFNAKGWLNFSKWFFCFIPIVCLIIICFFNSINLGDRFFFFTTATIPIILFRKTWTVYLIFYVSVAAFLFTSWYQGSHKPLVEIPKEFESQYYYFTLISVFAILFYVVRYFRADSEDYEKEIEAKNDIITEKNKEVRESIEYASRIQRALQTSEKYIDKELNRLTREK